MKLLLFIDEKNEAQNYRKTTTYSLRVTLVNAIAEIQTQNCLIKF